MSEQPATFAFTADSMDAAKAVIAKYPEGRQASACMPLLDIAQRQHDGWLPRAAMDYVADLLEMPAIRVYEVATFYTMYNKEPVGKHHVQVCTNISCMLMGSDQVVNVCKKKLGIAFGETTLDGQFTLSEVECLGACVNAPMMQIGDDYYEDLDSGTTEKVLDALAAGDTPKPGPQSGKRQGCEQTGTRTALVDGGDA